MLLAQPIASSYTFKLTDSRRFHPEWKTVPTSVRYGAEYTYGYDLVDSPAHPGDGVGKPFYFSVNVPDGNYRVVLTLGSTRSKGHTTVRAESRRLMAENVMTRKGEYKQVSFTVHKHSPQINAKERVRIKPREKQKLNWDEKLTLEFSGEKPVCAAIQIEAVSDVPTIFLCGNSTVVDQDEEPWASWGQMLPRWLDEGVSVANYAESGESANTFIAAGRLAKALSEMKAGDYLVVEFGHNDQKQKGPGKGAYYSFATSLKVFIDEARSRGATPILVTPTRRRVFDKEGRIVNTHADFPEAMRWVAEREEVLLFDLSAQTTQLFEALGVEGSKRALVHYPSGSFPGQTRAFTDNTHFNPYGAYEVAKCIVENLRDKVPALWKHVRPDYPAFNPSRPDNPDMFRWYPSPFVNFVKPDGD